MANTGIDIDKYQAHSVRSAVASKAKIRNVPIDSIRKTTGWSRESTVARVCTKGIKDTQYSNVILHEP